MLPGLEEIHNWLKELAEFHKKRKNWFFYGVFAFVASIPHLIDHYASSKIVEWILDSGLPMPIKNFFLWCLSNPLGWSVSVLILTVSGIFLHAYRSSRHRIRSISAQTPLPELNKFNENAVRPVITSSLTPEDPAIYVDLPEPKAAGFRTPFVLQNRGKITAHDVTIRPFKLKRKPVTFQTVSEIGPNSNAEVLPTVEGEGNLTTHNIFHWLVKDWDGVGKLSNDWPIEMTISYADPFGKQKYETTVTLLFHPITYITYERRASNWPAPPPGIKPVEFIRYGFKLLD